MASTPKRIVNNLAPKTLRERWNAYLNKGIGSGEDIDYWNNEIEEIEKSLPFKDQEEYNIWSDWMSDYRGSSDLLDLTSEILSRGEENYQGDKADDIIKEIYSKSRIPGNEYRAWAKKRGL